METTLAAVMPAPNTEIEVRALPVPDLEPGSALLRVELSEVCGTDVHLRSGRLTGVPYPIIPGHVCVGVLERIRGRMDDIDGRPFAEGDRVTFLDVHRTCHRCRACLIDKASTRCPHRKVYGITYGLADGLTGGWSRHVVLKPGTRVIRLGGTSGEQFMAGGCSLPTALHAVQRARITIGDTVLVLGAGPVGLSSVALARLAGAGTVLCIGAPAERLATATAMGADHTVSHLEWTEDQRRDWVASHSHGRGADVTIEATGVPGAVVEAMRWTRDAGRVVVVGQYTDAGAVPFNPHLDLNRKHLDVRGCWGSDYSHFHRAVACLSSPRLRRAWSHVPVRRYALDQANAALDDVAAGTVVKALIVPP